VRLKRCPRCGNGTPLYYLGGETMYAFCPKCQRYYDSVNRSYTKRELLKRLSSVSIEDILRENCGGIKFNDAQQKAFDEIMQKIEEGERRGIISLPTGAGKTLLAACILRKILLDRYLVKGRETHVLVLAPRKVIREQLASGSRDLCKVFRDIPKKTLIEIVEIAKGVEDYPVFFLDTEREYEVRRFNSLSEALEHFLQKEEPTYILVATPQLVKEACEHREAIREIIRKVKIVILDEVHHTYNGPKMSALFREVLREADYIIGLSATPTRESVENVGKVWVTYSVDEAMEKGILVRGVKFYVYDTEHEKLPKNIHRRWSRDEGYIWRNCAIEERAKKYAKMIVKTLKDEAKKCGQEDRILRTAVACPNIREADLLFEELQELLDEDLVFRIHYEREKKYGEKPEEVLEKFRKKQEGILVSVNMIDIGFDDKDLEALVIARLIRNPISYVQLRGRVLRAPSDGSKDWNIKHKLGYALIIDFANNYDRHEDKVEKVMKGEFEAGGFEKDLRGHIGKVEDVDAKVKVKQVGIFIKGPIEAIVRAIYNELERRLRKKEKCHCVAQINRFLIARKIEKPFRLELERVARRSGLEKKKLIWALYDTCKKGIYEEHRRKASYILSELCMEFTEPEEFREWLKT